MKLAIVIINYRTPDLVIECLKSLENQLDYRTDKVVVVDNLSGDNSLEKITEAIKINNWRDWVELIASKVNGGFSAGNNIGIKAVTAELYLLLNSDTIVKPGAIASLKEAAEIHPEAGLIGPCLELPEIGSYISTFRYHSPISQIIDAAGTGPVTKLLNKYDVTIYNLKDSEQIQWISFACVLIRRAVIEEVGFLDEGYFMYYEDVDYCRRAKQAGWKIIYWAAAHVIHLKGGSSEGKSGIKALKRSPRYIYASRSRYFAKFYGITGLWLANLCWLMGRSISLLREILNNKSRHAYDYQSQDIWTHWLNPVKQEMGFEILAKQKTLGSKSPQ